MSPEEEALLYQQRMREGGFSVPRSLAFSSSGDNWQKAAQDAILSRKVEEYTAAKASNEPVKPPENRIEQKAYDTVFGPAPGGVVTIDQLKAAESAPAPVGPVSTAPGPAELPPATEPPPTQPPADTPTTAATPATGGYPGMRSIRGKLRSLEEEIQRETDFQKAEYEQERKDYEKHLEEVSEASQVEAAREKMKFAEGALNTATDKLKNWEIDPHRAFPNAFSKVAAVIGVAMGAYAQGLSGGKLPNTALQIVNSAIDRDIDAQKTEYAKLKGLVDEKRNVYGMAMRMLGDERQADELARSAAYRSFKAQMDSMGRQFGLTNQQMSQKFNVLKLEEQENFHRASLMARAAKGSGKVDAKSKEEFATLQSIRGQLGKLKDLFKNKGPEDIPGSWKVTQAFFDTHGGKIEDARGLIARQLLMYTDKGRISDADYEIMMGFVPGVYKSQGRANSMIEGLAEMLNTIESARYDQMGAAQRSEFLRKKAVQLAQDNKLDSDIFSSSEDKSADYWRSQRAQTEVKE